ncbi:MAG: hypothetical protein D6B25_12305 [Desulfobulbaceae bacterium]|nr:MAG: hypothetical protein D6B25_12305 [Desulfobulbaceae bacterium]
MKKNLIIFVLIPLGINILFFSLYFSGIPFLQQLIAPKISHIPEPSWREFGLVELSQDFILLLTVLILICAFFYRKNLKERLFFLIGTLFILFLLFEEIDYGLHFYHYFSETRSEIVRLNWHNQHTFTDRENGRYLGQLGDLLLVVWFLVMPLVARKAKLARIRRFIPSPWFIATVVVALACSQLGHWLEDIGLATIDGAHGLLRGNISEFRETTIYYIGLLYSWQLFKTPTLFKLPLLPEGVEIPQPTDKMIYH